MAVSLENAIEQLKIKKLALEKLKIENQLNDRARDRDKRHLESIQTSIRDDCEEANKIKQEYGELQANIDKCRSEEKKAKENRMEYVTERRKVLKESDQKRKIIEGLRNELTEKQKSSRRGQTDAARIAKEIAELKEKEMDFDKFSTFSRTEEAQLNIWTSMHMIDVNSVMLESFNKKRPVEYKISTDVLEDKVRSRQPPPEKVRRGPARP